MRIVIPVAEEKLCMHFGHCEAFAFFDVNPEEKKIIHSRVVASPGHQPGFLPKWLAEQGANMIIAGGMGNRARMIFAEHDIEVVTGAPAGDPEDVIQAWMDGILACGSNPCDH